jgi:cation:H+ antiporter
LSLYKDNKYSLQTRDYFSGWLVFGNIGWLSGFLMVLPNGLLAVYYAAAGRADIVYSSQAGDAHICIPMCIGLYALFSPMQVPQFIQTGTVFLLAAALVHFTCVLILRRLPRIVAAGLVVVYGVFVYQGFLR